MSGYYAQLVNLTPHPIRIADEEIAPSGAIAKVSTTEVDTNVVIVRDNYDLPIFRRSFGEIENLPEPVDGVVYIVSSMVLDRVSSNRHDVIAPDTGRTAIRDENGNVFAVTRFIGK